MKKRANDNGVKSLLILCDNEGNLGDPNKSKRIQAVENHYKWAEAAKFLGCHSIRVNARSDNNLPYEEQLKLAADGLSMLVNFCDNINLNAIVENHGGLSSNGDWLSNLMKTVDHPRVGTLPDFGNFCISNDWGADLRCKVEYDKYKGVAELMPYAKSVSAKSYNFDENGNETKIDYVKMMKILKDHDYKGFIGVEYEGNVLNEKDGILATKNLIERLL